MEISDYINLIVAFAAIMTSILTFFMIKESRRMRKHYSSPELSIYLKNAEASPTLLFLFIENLGMGTAYDVSFKLENDFKHYKYDGFKLSNKAMFKKRLEYFYPQQKFEFLIDSLEGLTSSQLEEPLIITAFYKDVFGKKYSRKFILNIDLYTSREMITPGDTHARVISYHIEKIQQSLRTLTQLMEIHLKK